jgi:CheY-like chemotaxis protein
MDIMMPEMDGLTATRTIRSMDRTDMQTIPVIAMTANAFAEDKKAALEAGINGYVTKPIDTTMLMEEIRAAVVS